MPKILMVTSEATPFAKTGGLADVLGSLPPALRARGEDVAVVMPRYRHVAPDAAVVFHNLALWFNGLPYPVDIVSEDHRGVTFYFVDAPGIYDRAGLYGEHGHDYHDNAFRFAALSNAALGVARHLFRPDVLHCHDWQSALAPVYLRRYFSSDPTFQSTRILFTIHNLGYQGLFPKDVLPHIGLDWGAFRADLLEYYDSLNLMKGGIVYADAVSTVSPRYAQEIQTPEQGFGLDPLLRARSGVLYGILNGVDYHEWNPETDPHIAANYSWRDLDGKKLCKIDLLENFGLPLDHVDTTPVAGIISRFATQKGMDLVGHVIQGLIDRGVYLVVLGNGDRTYEDMFRYFAWARPDRVAVKIAYDNKLAHKIEAGADIFLMPSRYEPCGLNQIYSLRYGTIPVVRATGGLDDTIEDGTGFKFWGHTGPDFWGAIRYALDAFEDRVNWKTMMVRGMRKDFSWEASAAQYSALYAKLAG